MKEAKMSRHQSKIVSINLAAKPPNPTVIFTKAKNRIERRPKRRLYCGSLEKRLEDPAALSERLQKAVTCTIEAGYQLDSEAFTLLETLSRTEDPVALLEKIIKKMDELSQKPLFISRNSLEELITPVIEEQTETTVAPSPEPFLESKREPFKPYAKEIDSDIKVLDDPTNTMCTIGSIEEYQEYFLDRFRRLQKFLRQRIDAKDATSISEALKAPANSKVKVIGMLTEKRESKQRIFLRL